MARRSYTRTMLMVVGVAVWLGLTAPAALAATDVVNIRKVDTSKFPLVRMTALYTGATPSVADVDVRENGRLVTDRDVVPLGKSTTGAAIVLAIDTSGSMRAGDRIGAAKSAARSFVQNKLVNDRIALVAFAGDARVAVNFTTDAAPLLAGIEGLVASGETALWDGVRNAAGLFADQPGVLPYIVVLSDGADTVSQTTEEAAVGAVRSSQAGVFAVAITGSGESDVPALRRLAADTGGQFAETTDAKQVASIYSGVQRVLQNQYEITWTSTVRAAPLEVSVAIGGAGAVVEVPLNSVSLGDSAQPRVIAAPVMPASWTGGRAIAMIAALAALAAGFLGAGLVLLGRRERSLERMLTAYTGGPIQGAQDDDDADRSMVPESVRRAVEATARMTGGGGVLVLLDRKLDQADLKLRAQEAVLFYAAAIVLLGSLALAAAGPLLGLAAVVILALLPIAVLNQLSSRRRRAFSQQLPDTLQLLGSSLRAGYSLMQGLDAVSQEVENPMGRELRRVVLETRLGREVEAAMDDTAARMASPDFDWVVIAIRIQREVGGNLAELLASVAETMISRERLRREVSALTAEGRLSAVVVGALPVVVGLVLSVINPGYLNGLFSSLVGRLMVVGAVALAAVGFLWMKKTIEIDV